MFAVRQALFAVSIAIFAACASPPVPVAEPAVGAVVREPFEVDLGGWTSAAELVHPVANGAHGAGPWPVVLLVHGNGPHDMDVTLRSPEGETRLFATIAESLAARGFAVVRYHKRFVKAAGRFDARFWREQSTVTFTADAGTVLDAALQRPACDRERIVLYGWSEGTAIAAELAVRRRDVDALVLQGAVGQPWRDMVRGWILDVGLPYAQSANGGPVTAASLVAATHGPGGMVAKLGASFLADPATMRTPSPKVSPLLDTNGDGQLDPDREVRAAADAMLDFAFSPQGNTYIYAPGRTVKTVAEQVAVLTMPVLILQGENDASTPLASGRALHAAFAAAGHEATLWEFPGCGHTLGAASSVVDDHARSPDPVILARVAAWLTTVR